MPVALAAALFVAGAVVSLGTSYVLVTRLERIGGRLGLSEALLGVVAALAADAPEITSAVAALASHQSKIGAGVIIGSNVFNLAALLGLGAVVAGGIALHRRVVLLGGVVGIWIAVACLVTVLGLLSPAAGLIAVLVVLLPYLAVLAAGHARLQRMALTRRWEAWLGEAVAEEEQELEEVIHPRHGRGRDVAIAAGRPGDRGGGQRDHGAGGVAARHALRGPRDHHRRRRPRRGDQPAERGRRRLPGGQGTRRRHAEHHAEQQRAERDRRAAHPGHHHRARAALTPLGSHRGLVPGDDAWPRSRSPTGTAA